MIHFNIINIQYKVINYQYMQNLEKLNIAALTHHVIREMILEADEMHSLENARPLAEWIIHAVQYIENLVPTHHPNA